MYIIFKPVVVVGSLLSMAIPYRQETLDAEQTTTLSCSNGLDLGEMRCRQHQTIMTSQGVQSHIQHKSITND